MARGRSDPLPLVDPLAEFWRQVGGIAERRLFKAKEDPNDPYNWLAKARPEQLPPPWDWFLWLLKPGRRWGKTRAAAQLMREDIFGERQVRLGAFVGATPLGARKIMIEGPAGIMAVCRPEERPEFQPSLRRLLFPNGAVVQLYSATNPEEMRGPEHDGGWCDEVDAWAYAGPDSSPVKAMKAWENFLICLCRTTGGRFRARGVVTSTPKKGRIVASILARAADTGDTHVTGGHTRENAANLDPEWYASLLARYEGTALERQELAGELDESIEGALWHQTAWKNEQGQRFPGIDELRRKLTDPLPEMVRAAVAIDPPGGKKARNAEAGIMAGFLGSDGHGYLTRDRSGRMPPEIWGARAVELYDELQADAIVGEVNFGGEMVRSTVQAVRQGINFKAVSASRGKVLRAEPIAALEVQGLIHHVGPFPELERQQVQMTTAGYEGGLGEGDSPSPDRLDAYVWLMTELLLGGPQGGVS